MLFRLEYKLIVCSSKLLAGLLLFLLRGCTIRRRGGLYSETMEMRGCGDVMVAQQGLESEMVLRAVIVKNKV